MANIEDGVVVSNYLNVFDQKPVIESFVDSKEVVIYPQPGWDEVNFSNFILFEKHSVLCKNFYLE